MGTAKNISVALDFDHETKNTRRYVEHDANGEIAKEPKIGTIYVPKATLTALGDTEAKTVVVAVSL